MMGLDPLASREGGVAGHVLPRRIAGGEAEARVEHVGDRVALDLDQLAAAGGGLGRRLDGVEFAVQPVAEVPGLQRVRQQEHRRPLHGMLDHRGPGAAALADHAHAAAVTGHQRPLGGREGDVEVTLGMFSVHAQRPGQPQRHLHGSDEILDIAPRGLRIDRELANRLQPGSGFFGDEFTAPRRLVR